MNLNRLLALTLLSFTGSVAGASSVTWTLVELEPLAGSNTSRAMTINNAGMVAGECTPGPVSTFWAADRTAVRIGHLPGHIQSSANDINAAGQVTGFSLQSVNHRLIKRAVVWSVADGLQDLGPLAGNESNEGFAIGPDGRVFGGGNGGGAPQGFAWSADTGMRALVDPTWPMTVSDVRGANTAGALVGSGVTLDGRRGFVWSASGGLTPLGTLLGDGWSAAIDINDRGWVTGASRLNDFGASRAFVLPPFGQMTHIDAGSVEFAPAAVNNLEQVVGTATNSQAVVWDPVGGSARVADLAGAVGQGWQFLSANDVNDRGEIVGAGVSPSGLLRGFILRPRFAVTVRVVPSLFQGNVAQEALSVIVRRDGVNVRTFGVRPASDGTFTVDLTGGRYELLVKGRMWLRAGGSTVLRSEAPGVVTVRMNPGDVNMDNAVTATDVSMVNAALNSRPGDSRWRRNADLNGDLRVDSADLKIVRARLGQNGLR